MALITDLPEPVGTRDKQVRHAGKIGDQRLTADVVLAERERQLGLGPFHVVGAENFTEADHFACRVWKLDTDRVAAGNDGDADAQGRHGPAMSSESPITREVLVPGAGFNS